MAFGFPATYERRMALAYDLKGADALMFIEHTFFHLEWSECARWGNGIRAFYGKIPIWRYSITATCIGANMLRVRSQGGFPYQFFDLGRNEQNVKKFIEVFENLDRDEIRRAVAAAQHADHHQDQDVESGDYELGSGSWLEDGGDEQPDTGKEEKPTKSWFRKKTDRQEADG